jgi:4-carboxymuconolactone decarboxylase
MPRIPELTRDDVPEELREAFDAVMATGKPQGPSAIAIHSPELARRRGPLSNYLRFETSIPDRILELAILITARCMDCPYVWNAHAGPARKAGVSEALIAALRWNDPIPDAPADETALVTYGQELLRTHAVREKTFKEAHEQFGTQHLVELTSLMGHYAQNAFFLNAFAVELPADTEEPKLPVGVELESEF